MESSTPEPEPSELGSSERSPELSESSDTDRTSPELSGLVVLGTLTNGAFETCDEVVDGSVVDVEVLVVGAELVDEVTATGAGSSTGTGFCQTERDVGAPMLGNSVSRIAYAVPADPITAATATIATTARLDRDRHTPELWPSATSISGADLTGLRESPSPCPWSSQFSLTGHTLHAERSEHHRTLVVVPGINDQRATRESFAAWTLRGDELDDDDVTKAARHDRSVFLTVGVAFFLAELGDKTQLRPTSERHSRPSTTARALRPNSTCETPGYQTTGSTRPSNLVSPLRKVVLVAGRDAIPRRRATYVATNSCSMHVWNLRGSRLSWMR